MHSLNQPKITPTVLALHLTYRCPLKCDHCCVDAGPTRKGGLTTLAVRELINEAAAACGIGAVGITGGDPFLLPEHMSEALSAARDNGMRTHIVTSAYWAKSAVEARRRLDALPSGLLDELCISYDDAHAKYVSLERILHAYEAAIARRIPVRFMVTEEPSSAITAESLRKQLLQLDSYDPALTAVERGSLLTTGRSAQTTDETRKKDRLETDDKYLGPCPIIFRRLAVNPEGNILACCGTVPFYPDLAIGNVATDSISDACESMYRSDLLKWIAFEGPVEILRQVTQDDEAPLTYASFEGICQACDMMFSRPELRARAYKAAHDQRDRLAIEELVFRSLGHFPEFSKSQALRSS